MDVGRWWQKSLEKTLRNEPTKDEMSETEKEERMN